MVSVDGNLILFSFGNSIPGSTRLYAADKLGGNQA